MAAASVNCTRSMTRVDSGRTFDRSSSSITTYRPFSNSYPLTSSVFGTSRSQCGHQRFCWMRVWHSPWSWLNEIVALDSVAGNTLMGMFTRLTLRYPFQVARAAMRDILSELLAASYWLLAARYLRLATCGSLLAARYLRLATCCSLLAACYLRLEARS